MGNIARYFNRSEFACNCGCGFDDISMNLVRILSDIREEIRKPMTITSGCRCEAWNKNKKVGGKPNSAHLTGLAVDIYIPDSRYRFNLLHHLWAYDIQRIGVGKTLVHCDLDVGKPQNVLWIY